jgi:sRNA-binding protein
VPGWALLIDGEIRLKLQRQSAGALDNDAGAIADQQIVSGNTARQASSREARCRQQKIALGNTQAQVTPEVDHLVVRQHTANKGKVLPDVMPYHLSFAFKEPQTVMGFFIEVKDDL